MKTKNKYKPEYKLGKRYVVNDVASCYRGMVGTLIHMENGLLWLQFDENYVGTREVSFHDFTTSLSEADVYDEIRNLDKNDMINVIQRIREGKSPVDALHEMTTW